MSQAQIDKLLRENHVLREQVRSLREALGKAHEGLKYAAEYLDDLDSETVVEAVDKGLEAANAALEATKD